MKSWLAWRLHDRSQAGSWDKDGIPTAGLVWAVDPAAERGDGSAFRDGHATLTVVAGEVVMQQ
jgi:hypothetical protein